MSQFARPDGDTTITGLWVNEAAGTTNLFQSIDEVTASDTDYVQSASNPDGTALYECGLSNATDPAVSTGHVIRYRMGKDITAGRTINVDVALYQGTSLVVSWTHLDMDAAASHEQTLTGPQTDAITDYADIRFRFNPTATGGGAARKARIYWIEMELPDAPAGAASVDPMGMSGFFGI
jgi:hypothetical protein